MDPHVLSAERSLAYHRAVAERLRREPEILARVRARVEQDIARGGRAVHYHERWRAVLARPVEEVLAFLVDPGEEACDLHRATPFAGVADARERWRIWRDVRERLEGCEPH